MVVIMKRDATEADVAGVVERAQECGLVAHVSKGAERTIVGLIGHGVAVGEAHGRIESMPGVESLVPVTKPFKLVSREFHEEDTIVEVNGVRLGDSEVVAIAGPCSVESREQTLETAHAVREAGARLLRGGAYKPRTSPYSFRGLGERALDILAEAREQTGLGIVTEVMAAEELPTVLGYADVLQIGARNMHNYSLLEAVGRCDRPVMIKRGLSATIEEWLLAAEYVMAGGNRQVVLCERGIRTFDTYTRNTFDVSSIPLVKRLSHLPVIGDPSHATGKWYLVGPTSLAAVAAGADGLMVEVHPHPEHALSDSAQQLTFQHFSELMSSLKAVAAAIGRTVGEPKEQLVRTV